MISALHRINALNAALFPANQNHERYPIDDEEHVDERRAAVGLPPLAEYLKLFNLAYQPPAKK